MTLAEGAEMEPEKRARMFKIVTDSMETVIRLQRQAWGIDPKGGGHNALDAGAGAHVVVEIARP